MADTSTDSEFFNALFGDGTYEAAVADPTTPAVSTGGSDGWFSSLLSGITSLGTAGLNAYGGILNSQANKNLANSIAQANTAKAAGAAQTSVNWSKYLPWAVGAALLLGVVIFLFNRRSK